MPITDEGLRELEEHFRALRDQLSPEAFRHYFMGDWDPPEEPIMYLADATNAITVWISVIVPDDLLLSSTLLSEITAPRVGSMLQIGNEEMRVEYSHRFEEPDLDATRYDCRVTRGYASTTPTDHPARARVLNIAQRLSVEDITTDDVSIPPDAEPVIITPTPFLDGIDWSLPPSGDAPRIQDPDLPVNMFFDEPGFEEPRSVDVSREGMARRSREANLKNLLENIDRLGELEGQEAQQDFLRQVYQALGQAGGELTGREPVITKGPRDARKPE